eukprot:TRINITY_DN38087_c0_g1_i1.p1 TRINITY_DN38087_c0_g1~~TRINITY_DN38087_c0_g1_i1.p1  ORF type:complete len:231 (-),score=68.83 TRINITY_DN38087_c0_g1_i1:280-972(-)
MCIRDSINAEYGGQQADEMPEEERQYGSRTYWDQRYSDPANQEAFEWLQDYKALAEHIARECPNKNGKVLVVGTGRSNLAKDMNSDGYTEVVGVDFCSALIDKLNSREGSQGLSYECCAVQDLGSDARFAENSVDYVIDKAVLDSILCGVNSTQQAFMYLKALKTVLKPGGKALVVSYGKPSKRDEHIKRSSLFPNDKCKDITLEKPVAAGVTPAGSGIDPNHYLFVLQN